MKTNQNILSSQLKEEMLLLFVSVITRLFCHCQEKYKRVNVSIKFQYVFFVFVQNRCNLPPLQLLLFSVIGAFFVLYPRRYLLLISLP